MRRTSRPSKPRSSRSTSASRAWYWPHHSPLTLLYAVMTEATPSSTVVAEQSSVPRFLGHLYRLAPRGVRIEPRHRDRPPAFVVNRSSLTLGADASIRPPPVIRRGCVGPSSAACRRPRSSRSPADPAMWASAPDASATPTFGQHRCSYRAPHAALDRLVISYYAYHLRPSFIGAPTPAELVQAKGGSASRTRTNRRLTGSHHISDRPRAHHVD
jgi:hypothetical protein